MKLFILLFLSLLTSACPLNASETNQNEIKPLIERIEGCNHFAGEFNGDNSDRDKEVNAEMDKLKCGDVDKDLAIAKEKYKNNSDVLKALEQADNFND